VFFGREELVQLVVDCVKHSKPVALSGAEGIGKTSIARALLHNQSVIDSFQDERRFVSCDRLEGAVSVNSFLNLIAETVGVVLNKGDHLGSLQSFFDTRKILIVLDSAETVLDSPTDFTQISEVIRTLALHPSVSLILTTRTAILPYNVNWTRIQVPVLDESAAKDAFFVIYPLEDHPVSKIEELLAALEYHPLSIYLLAQAGAQKLWTPSELMDYWNEQKTRWVHLNRPVVSNLESLSVTIELLLNPTLY
jgi:hypothetical protein